MKALIAVRVSIILEEGAWVREQYNFTEDEDVFWAASANKTCFKICLQSLPGVASNNRDVPNSG